MGAGQVTVAAGPNHNPCGPRRRVSPGYALQVRAELPLRWSGLGWLGIRLGPGCAPRPRASAKFRCSASAILIDPFLIPHMSIIESAAILKALHSLFFDCGNLVQELASTRCGHICVGEKLSEHTCLSTLLAFCQLIPVLKQMSSRANSPNATIWSHDFVTDFAPTNAPEKTFWRTGLQNSPAHLVLVTDLNRGIGKRSGSIPSSLKDERFRQCGFQPPAPPATEIARRLSSRRCANPERGEIQ